MCDSTSGSLMYHQHHHHQELTSSSGSDSQHAMRHTQIIMEEKLRSMKMMQLQRQIERKMMMEERPDMEMKLARMKQQQQQQGGMPQAATLDLSSGSGSMNNSRSPPFLSSQGPSASLPPLGGEQQQQQPIFVRAVYMPHHQDLMTAQGPATYAPVADFSGSSARFAQAPGGYAHQFASTSALPMFASAPGPCSRQVSLSPSTDEMFTQERAKQLSLRQAALQQELEDLQQQKDALLFRPRAAPVSYLPQQSSLAMQQELAASRQHMAEMAYRQASIDQQEQEIRELTMYRKLRTQLPPQPEYMSSMQSSLGNSMMNQQHPGPGRLSLEKSRMLLQGSSLSTSPELAKQRQEIIQRSASLGGPQNSPEVQQLLKEAYRVLEDPPSAPQQHQQQAQQPSPQLQDQVVRLPPTVQQAHYAAAPPPAPERVQQKIVQAVAVPKKQEVVPERKPAPVEVRKREPIPASVHETDNEEEEEDESDREEDCSTDDDDSEDRKPGKKTKTVVKSHKKSKNVLERKTPRKDLQWMYSYDMLKSYKEVNGDCIVPRGYAPNPPLGSWVAEQRKQFKRMKLGKNSTLTKDRIEMLEKLHFAWDAQRAAWDGHFENLIHFKEKYGHCHVSLGDTDFPKLGLWVKEQRRHYGLMHTGGQTHMNEDRIKQLEEVGFCWDTQEATWLVRFLELKRYKQRHGDCLVPEQFKENPLLGSWVQFQRRQYKRLVDGEVGHHVLTQTRINKLNSVGFYWDLEDEDTIKKRKKNAKAIIKEKKRSRSNGQDDEGSYCSTDNDMEEDESPLKQKRKFSHDLLHV